MRVRNRTRDLHAQAQPVPHRQPAGLAPGVDGLAVDVLQRQVGAAALVDAGVVQTRDGGMLEARADLALAGHPLGQSGAPRQPRQLDRDLALEAAVGAFGQPHAAHAAAPDLAQQAVGADAVAGMCHGLVGGLQVRAVAEKRAALRRPRLGEHVAQSRREMALRRRQRGQPRLDPGRIELERGIEQLAQERQVGRGDDHGRRSEGLVPYRRDPARKPDAARRLKRGRLAAAIPWWISAPGAGS